MGKDRKFCHWSVNKSGEKITDFKIHKDACLPTVGWSQSLGGQYCPPTPRGNLFAFESEDKFVLTCALQQALVYQVGRLFVWRVCMLREECIIAAAEIWIESLCYLGI